MDIVRSVRRDLKYPLPRLRIAHAQTGPPRVYFCAPDYDVPSGGIRVVYRHVDLLNAAGIDAAVLHRSSDFRCSWFENETQVVGSDDILVRPRDLVIVSELAIGLLRELPAGHRFVVFNQNPYLTWQRVDYHEVDSYASSPDLAAIVTVSSYSAEMIRHAAPQANVLRLHNSIDPKRFFPGEQRAGPSIVYMPRGAKDEVRQVLGILHGRGVLDGWDVVALDGLTEREVAERLRSASIFLSFAYHEGFGLPAAEAMACGAYAIGFHGFAGREYLRPEFSRPVEPGDVLEMARAVEEVIARERQEPGWCAKQGATAAAFIAAEYSPERERDEVIAAYTALMHGQ
jgi:glycosyltransferase involved in cell wall biosynthesis